jgi:hypothetical protein
MADGELAARVAPSNPIGPAPLRRPGSIRRTTSIETTWPDGRGGMLTMVGRARDAVTPAEGGAPRVLALDAFRARLQERTITEIEATPARPKIGQLVGARGGGHLRIRLDELMPEERANATPLHLIVDDVSGASLVANWAWSQWSDDFGRDREAAMAASGMDVQAMRRRMEGVCHGFAPGSSALARSGMSTNAVPVVDLRHPEDPEGWHDFTPQDGAIGMRRARRIDVWRDDLIRIDAGFQDSATHPDGGRVAIHEYHLAATADPVTGKMLTIEVEPRVLPFPECPGASTSADRILGAALGDLRAEVLKTFPGTLGCTHLNDMLRSLAEVPALVARLEAAVA